MPNRPALPTGSAAGVALAGLIVVLVSALELILRHGELKDPAIVLCWLAIVLGAVVVGFAFVISRPSRAAEVAGEQRAPDEEFTFTIGDEPGKAAPHGHHPAHPAHPAEPNAWAKPAVVIPLIAAALATLIGALWPHCLPQSKTETSPGTVDCVALRHSVAKPKDRVPYPKRSPSERQCAINEYEHHLNQRDHKGRH